MPEPLEPRGSEDLDIGPAEIVMQTDVVNGALAFLRPFIRDDDAAAAWDFVAADLRTRWARWWTSSNAPAMRRHGLDPDALATELADVGPSHEYWEHFARVLLRARGAKALGLEGLDYDGFGIGAAARVVAPDVELLYLHPELPPDGLWRPGTARRIVPILMKLEDDTWRVLDLGTEELR